MTDEVIAMGCAVILFFIPADWRRGQFVLDWRALDKMPWGVLILFVLLIPILVWTVGRWTFGL